MSWQRRLRRRGTSATELAITLPLLLALCVATSDVGRFAHAYVALHHASRVGADYGATRLYTPYADATWKQAVSDAATAEMALVAGCDPSELDVSVQVVMLDDTFHRVIVSCQYNFPLVLAWPGMTNPLPMRSTVAMRRYR